MFCAPYVQEVNALNRLALEGILAVIESISRRCHAPSPAPPLSAASASSWKPSQRQQQAGFCLPLAPDPRSGGGGVGVGVGGGGGGMLGVGDDLSRRSSVSDSDSDQDSIGGEGGGRGARDELSWLESARARTAEVLQERKKMKRRLGLAAQRFNTGSKGWLEYAQELGLIPTPKTALATASFLKGTLLLDKSMLGEYLSRGPADKYPFNAQVRRSWWG
ncbi:unnamed protein product, partial [Laminaria digitata]